MFDNSKVSDISIIKPAERVEGCELVLIKRDKDPQSKSFRSVTFEFCQKITGSKLDFREFAPNRVINGKTITNEEFKKNIGMAHSRIAHITRAFLDEETFLKIITPGDLDQTLAANNYAAIDQAWDAYIQMTGAALGATATGVEKAKEAFTDLGPNTLFISAKNKENIHRLKQRYMQDSWLQSPQK